MSRRDASQAPVCRVRFVTQLVILPHQLRHNVFWLTSCIEILAEVTRLRAAVGARHSILEFEWYAEYVKIFV